MSHRLIRWIFKSTGIASILVGLTLSYPFGATVQGASYPVRAITFVTPYAPGGMDLEARVVAADMQKTLGQPVLVEPRGGGGGTIGTNYVAQSKPDGYILLYSSATQLTLAPLLSELPYTLEDLIPIASTSILTNVLAVNANAKWKNIQEFVDYGKKNPGAIKFGSGGVGTALHMLAEALAFATGMKIAHVPYKGSGDAMIAVIGGHIDCTFAMAQTVLPQVRGKKIRVLATAGANRFPDFPEAPTFTEIGIPIDPKLGVNWQGVCAPKGTPKEVCDIIGAAIRKSMARPETIKTFKEIGSFPNYNDSKGYKAFLVEQSNLFKGLVDKLDLKNK